MLGTIYDRKSGEFKEFEEIKEFLDKNGYTLFNYKNKKDTPSILNSHGSRYDTTGIANYLYDPHDIPEDYKPVIRGYLKESEDWELKQYDFANALIALKKLEAEELYYDFKLSYKKKNTSNNLSTLFKDLKTGDTLVVLSAADLVNNTSQFIALIEYLEYSKICFITNGVKVDFRNKVSVIEKGILSTTGTHQINEKELYNSLIDMPTNPKEIRKQETWRLKQLAAYEDLKKRNKIK